MDRYHIVGAVGRGGMAEVYRAHDLKMGVDVALKFLRDDLVEDPLTLRHFRREANILQLLQHPNVVRLYEFQEIEIDGRLRAFMALDLVEGATLRRELSRGGDRERGLGRALSLRETWQYLKPIGAALHYAHSLEYTDEKGSHRGIIHCDLKPSNVLIDTAGKVYVADFGIARLAEGAGTTTALTPTGTLYYMAPEQWNSERPDARTDVYALGVMLYEMLTGTKPFTGETESTTDESTSMRIRWQHLHEEPVPLNVRRPAIPVSIDAVVLKCLKKDPAARYANVATLVHDFGAELGETVQATVETEQTGAMLLVSDTATFDPQPSAIQSAPIDAEFERQEQAQRQAEAKRARLPWTMPSLLVVVILISLAAVIVFGLGGRQADSRAATAVSLAQTVGAVNVTQTALAFVKTTSPARATTLAPAPAVPLQSPTTRPTGTALAGNSRSACPGARPSRLHIGDRAYVSYDPPDPNRVRAQPGTDASVLGRIYPGEEVLILDGPECANGWVWWKVQSLETGLTGWTSEGDLQAYWLVPFP